MASITCVIPLGKEDPRFLKRCLSSIPDWVDIFLVDDTPSHKFAAAVPKRVSGRVEYYRYGNEPSPYHRVADAIRFGCTLVKSDIIGGVDEDTDFNVAYAPDLDADCIIPDDFFRKVERILTRYYNLVVFGMRIDTDFEYSFKRQRYTHPDIIWSTENNIKHAWNLMHADGTFFIRRDFLETIGGYPGGIGYGEEKADLCRRVIKNGGVVGIFRDLPYYHIMHDSKLWRRSVELPCNFELYRDNQLVEIRV